MISHSHRIKTQKIRNLFHISINVFTHGCSTRMRVYLHMQIEFHLATHRTTGLLNVTRSSCCIQSGASLFYLRFVSGRRTLIAVRPSCYFITVCAPSNQCHIIFIYVPTLPTCQYSGIVKLYKGIEQVSV